MIRASIVNQQYGRSFGKVVGSIRLDPDGFACETRSRQLRRALEDLRHTGVFMFTGGGFDADTGICWDKGGRFQVTEDVYGAFVRAMESHGYGLREEERTVGIDTPPRPKPINRSEP